MTSGANSRTISRLLIVAAVALVFAGCTALLATGDSALLIDFAG